MLPGGSSSRGLQHKADIPPETSLMHWTESSVPCFPAIRTASMRKVAECTALPCLEAEV